MENLCENCILYGSCDGRCGDTAPLFYWEEEQNDSREYLDNIMNTATEQTAATAIADTAMMKPAKTIRMTR